MAVCSNPDRVWYDDDMASVFPTDAEAFHRFLTEQLNGSGQDRSPEELLAVWRAKHPSTEELTESIAAVRGALDDMEAGDVGRPARIVLDELRGKHSLPEDP